MRYAAKLSQSIKGRPAWNKGLPNPQAIINGKNSANKQRQTVIGRKMAIREDGSRYWTYPNKKRDISASL
jgi:hypothetical protein